MPTRSSSESPEKAAHWSVSLGTALACRADSEVVPSCVKKIPNQEELEQGAILLMHRKYCKAPTICNGEMTSDVRKCKPFCDGQE